MIERMSYYSAVSDSDSIADRRKKFEQEQQHRIEERKQQVALLSSPLSTADERIQLWEKLHALALPRSPTHKLLPIIAQQTAIALAEVLEIQQRRSASVPLNPAV